MPLNKENEFKVGDTVKILRVRDGNEECLGRVGKVITVEGYGKEIFHIEVSFDGQNVSKLYSKWWYLNKDVEPFSCETKITKASQLKLGDTIRVDELFSPSTAGYQIKKTLGLTGKVVEICTNRYVGVEFDRYIGEHSCSGKGKQGHCLYIAIEDDCDQFQKLYSVSVTKINNSDTPKKTRIKTKRETPPKPIDVSTLKSLIEKGFMWLAKDQDGTIFAYKSKPKMDIGGKQWYVANVFEDCKVFKGFSVGTEKLDFYWGLPVALADIVADIKKYLV